MTPEEFGLALAGFAQSFVAALGFQGANGPCGAVILEALANELHALAATAGNEADVQKVAACHAATAAILMASEI